MNDLTLTQKTGQLFIVGFEGASLYPGHHLVEDIRERNLGGVILFNRLIAKKMAVNNIVSPAQVRALTRELQDLAQGSLLITADQEGGKVSRFAAAQGFPTTPAATELGRHPDSSTAAAARQTATMLADAGVNLNFAPVADIDLFPENPIITRYGRSFGASPALVINHCRAWIREHDSKGVLTCLKHFPGHGSSRADSHLGFTDVTATWQREELEPFRQLIDEGLAHAVMTGHLFNSNLDPKLPATLSRATIESLLRNDLGFTGAAISDDMQMKAITSRYGLAEACIMALDAGIDLIVIGNNLEHDPCIFRKVQQAVCTAVEEGRLDGNRIDTALKRVKKMKNAITRNFAP